MTAPEPGELCQWLLMVKAVSARSPLWLEGPSPAQQPGAEPPAHALGREKGSTPLTRYTLN